MIYERMKNIRTYYGHTQSQIANVLKVSRSTYAGWENGIDSIILPNLNNFCNYYKVSLDYICGLSNIKEIKLENKEIDKIKLGNNLKEIRLKNNHTQEKVAKILNIDQSNYSKCELGKIYLHTYSLIEFAKYYKVSIDWLSGKSKDSNIN